MQHVEKSPEPDGCWLWRGYAPNGYGRMSIAGHMQSTHRIAYRLFVAPIPEGLDVCHRCDTPACVNPAHLFVGTRQDNLDDMVDKGRHWWAKHEVARERDKDGGLPLPRFADRLAALSEGAPLQLEAGDMHAIADAVCRSRTHVLRVIAAAQPAHCPQCSAVIETGHIRGTALVAEIEAVVGVPLSRIRLVGQSLSKAS